MSLIEVIGGFIFLSCLLVVAGWAADEWRNRR